MTVLVELEAPVGIELVEELSRRIGAVDNPPDGLIAHAVVEQPGGGIRAVDLWQSRADFEHFQQTVLMPAMGQLMTERSMELSEDEIPTPRFSEAYDFVAGKSLA
jgi:hypothetical protein